MEPSPPRLLSIQSHVVHGYVGNRSVVFPLQLLGFEVDFINSVQFSNHTGYPNRWTGQVLNGEQLVDLVNGLERNSLLNYQYLLTGYVGSPTFLHNLLQAHSTLLKYSPNLIWACDPVMGDNGKLYVAPELVPLYRDEVVPRATILTPNQFECQLLTGMEINSNEDAAAACDKLHSLGPRAVIITSMEVPGSPGSLQLYASVSRKWSAERGGAAPAAGDGAGGYERFTVVVPKLPGVWTGTGDLVAALLLAWSHRTGGDWPRACRLVMCTMRAVLSRTLAAGGGELRLVQSKEDIERPPEAPDVAVRHL